MATKPRNTAAFTIVELLIAVAITSLIVVMMGTIFAALTSSASRANQQIDAFRDARAALQVIERDLTGIVRAPNTAYVALDDRYSDPFTGGGPSQKNQQIYALVSAKNSGIGDVCAVGFYCRWDPSTKSYSLRRYFRDSNELMAQSGYFSAKNPPRAVPPWNIVANGAGNYMRSDHLYQPSDTDALSGNPPTIKDDVLASYVWNFRITSYKSDGTIDSTYPLIIDPSNSATQMPAAIEISFSAVSPEAAKTIINANPTPDDWMTSGGSHRLLTPHTYDFRTRITL